MGVPYLGTLFIVFLFENYLFFIIILISLKVIFILLFNKIYKDGNINSIFFWVYVSKKYIKIMKKSVEKTTSVKKTTIKHIEKRRK